MLIPYLSSAVDVQQQRDSTSQPTPQAAPQPAPPQPAPPANNRRGGGGGRGGGSSEVGGGGPPAPPPDTVADASSKQRSERAAKEKDATLISKFGPPNLEDGNKADCPHCKKKVSHTPNWCSKNKSSPVYIKPEDIACRNCNRTGHETSNCPAPPKCYTCGQEGHQSKDCSQEAPPKGARGPRGRRRH
jgi:hypothetical protein